jgi:hypothetical protein
MRTASYAAEPRSVMPRHTKPKDLSINLKATEAHNAPPERPVSSPIALEGIDLSSIEGGIGMTSVPSLPSSPPTSPGRPKELSKNILQSLRPGKSRDRSKERQLKDQENQRIQTRQVGEDENRRPGSGSMSQIYHLRQAPGSTPELSLVGSAENVAKSNNGGMLILLSCASMCWRLSTRGMWPVMVQELGWNCHVTVSELRCSYIT